MDLVIVNKQKHVHYILPIIIFFSTIILSYAKIQETALPFLLPLFIVSFYSGYLYLICFLTAIIGISIINQDTFTIVVIITLLLTIYLLNFTHLLRTKYISFIMTAILIPFFYANHYNILQTTVLVMLTLFNCYLDQEIIPLIIHQNKNVLNIKRLQALIVVVCTLFISFIPFNTTYTMIFLRYFLLISIYYLSIEKVMPIILYLSILLMLIAPSLKDDVLSLILPMSFFFMIQPKNKYLFMSIFLLSHITLPFFINYNYFYYAFVILVPVFLFMISPQFKNKKIKINPEFIEISYQEQLKSKADAFASLFHQLTEVFKEENQETHLSEYLGTISLKNIDLKNKNAEYAISTRKKARGTGANQKATESLLKYGFDKLQLHRIYLNVLSSNKRAISFYKKCGFIYEGKFKDHLFIDDRYQDLEWYAICKK